MPVARRRWNRIRVANAPVSTVMFGWPVEGTHRSGRWTVSFHRKQFHRQTRIPLSPPPSSDHSRSESVAALPIQRLLDPGKLPVAGVATARKVLDDQLPSNELMKRTLRDEDL